MVVVAVLAASYGLAGWLDHVSPLPRIHNGASGAANGSANTTGDGAANLARTFVPYQPAPTCSGLAQIVDFTEIGLWNGTSWGVNLSGTSQSTSSNSTGFCEAPGSYGYCVGVGTGVCTDSIPYCDLYFVEEYSISPRCGTVTVAGSGVTVNVSFRQTAAPCPGGVELAGPNPTPSNYYEVNFTESGLPYGTRWGISSPGLPAPEASWNTTTSTSLCLRFANGTYSYSSGSLNGHWAGGSGTFTVVGPATRPARIVCGIPEGSVVVVTAVATVPLTFTITTYTVWFNETGLPNGTSWWVNVTGGQISGTMSLEATGTSQSARLVNGYSDYNYTAASADRDYDWPHSDGAVAFGVNGKDRTFSVGFAAVTYPVTFTESGLPASTVWYVNISGQAPLSDTTTSGGGVVSTALTNGTYTYKAAAAGTYRSPAASFTLDGPSGTTYLSVVFTYSGVLPFTPPIVSQFRGPFLSGATDFYDIFGVYTSHPTYAVAVSVNGTIGSSTISFVDEGGGLWNASVDVDDLASGAVLNIVATYPNGSYAKSAYPIWTVTPPSWLVSFIGWTDGGGLSLPLTSEWNNSYSLDLLGDFDLSGQFSLNIPFPEFAGGGSYGFVPAMQLSLTLTSGGVLNLTAGFSIASPDIDAGPVTVSVHATFSASGSFDVTNSSVVWESASLTFSLSGSVSVNIPIAGYTFNVPGYGSVTIGLSATISVSPSVAATLVLLPSTSSGLDILPGLDVMLGSISATIGADLNVALNAGVGGLSISGGGGVGVTLYIQPSQPYIDGGKITGTVSVNYQVLWWSGTIWSESGTLYSWGNDPAQVAAGSQGPAVPSPDAENPSSPNGTPPSYIPRYYSSVPGYDALVWLPKSPSGVAVNDIYPFTSLAAANGNGSTLLLYSNDNVGLPEDDGLTLDGLSFNATTDTVAPVSVNLPSLGSEVAFDPETIQLANGSYAVVWNSLPFGVTSVASPFNLTASDLELAYYDPTSSSWTGPFTLFKGGFSQSYALSVGPAGVEVLDQVGATVLSNASVLYAISPTSGVVASLPVDGVSRIDAFRAASGLAVVALNNSSYELLNVSTGVTVNATAGLACPIAEMSFVHDAADQVATLLTGDPNDTLVLYSSSAAPVVVSLPRNVSTMTATDYDGRVLATISGPFGVRVYLISGSHVDLLQSEGWANVTQLATALSGSHLVVFATTSYGNYTEESGRSTFSYEDLRLASVALGQVNVTFVAKGLPKGTSWSVTTGTPLTTTSTTQSTLTLPQPFGPLLYVANATNGYGLASVRPAADAAPLNVSGATTVTLEFARVGVVQFDARGLPNGTGWSVHLTTPAMGGPLNETLSSTSTTLSTSLVADPWTWTVGSSDRAYALHKDHGMVHPGKRTTVVHLNFYEVVTKLTIVERGLPKGTSWTVSIDGSTPTSVHGSQLVVRLPNGTYDFVVNSSNPAYSANPGSGALAVVAPRPVSVTIYFRDP